MLSANMLSAAQRYVITCCQLFFFLNILPKGITKNTGEKISNEALLSNGEKK
jgi:hypothetical protein